MLRIEQSLDPTVDARPQDPADIAWQLLRRAEPAGILSSYSARSSPYLLLRSELRRVRYCASLC